MSAPLIVLAALRTGEAAAAQTALEHVGEPFAAVPGTHLARVQVLEPRGRRWRPRPRPYLLLHAEHDGPIAPWLIAMAPALDGVLAHCAFWPGAADPAAVAEWVQERRLPVGFSVTSTDATVPELTAALATRERVIDLLTAAPDLTDAELQASWTEGQA